MTTAPGPVVTGRRALLVGLFLSVFGVAFEMIGIATAMPTIMDLFGAGGLYAWAFSTFVIGQLLATILAGRVADRRGPLAPMAAGFGAFLLGLVLAALAPGVGWFFAARLLQGLGAGGLMLALYVTIALAFRGAERAGVLGWISFVWLLPAFVGPPLAAWLTTISWRLVFAVMLPLLVAAALLALGPMRRVQAAFRPGEQTHRFPAWATLAVALSPAAVQLAGQGLGVWSVAAGVGGVVGLAAGLGRVMPPTIRLLGRGLGAVVSSRALQAGAFFAAEAFMLLVLRDLRGFDPLAAGLVLTIGSVGWTAGAWLQARPWLRLRRDQLISAGTVLVSAGLLAEVAFIAFGWPVALGLGGWVVAGLGMGVQLPSTAVALMDLSGSHEQGVNNSALQVAEGVGNALMTGIAGAVYATMLPLGDPAGTFLAVFACLLAVVLLGIAVTRRIGPIVNTSLAPGRSGA